MALYDVFDTGYTDYHTRMMRRKRQEALGWYYRNRTSFGGTLEDAWQTALKLGFQADPAKKAELEKLNNMAKEMEPWYSDFSNLLSSLRQRVMTIGEANSDLADYYDQKMNAFMKDAQNARNKFESAIGENINEMTRGIISHDYTRITQGKQEYYNAMSKTREFFTMVDAKTKLSPAQLQKETPPGILASIGGAFGGVKTLIIVGVVGYLAVKILPDLLKRKQSSSEQK